VQQREVPLKDVFQQHYTIADKLTGNRDRSLTPPRREDGGIAHKVNVPDEDGWQLTIRQLNKERCVRHGIPPKITTSTLGGKVTDRTFLRSQSPDKSYLSAQGKITSMPAGYDDRRK
jgi:hypothetical protein